MISNRDLLKIGAVALFCVLFRADFIIGGGLSTQLGEVVIENLQVGQQYNLKDLANLGLPVTNKSEVGVNLKLEVLIPADSELKFEAEPVPEGSWIKLSDSLFHMEAGETVEADIFISIPDDDQYLGKKYQVMVWSHTIPGDETGMFLAYGLKSRIIFTIDTVRVVIDDQSKGFNGAQSFLLEPSELTIEQDHSRQLADDFVSLLMITNTSETSQTFKVDSRSSSEAMTTAKEGYLFAPNASFLSFNFDEVTLEPGQSQKIKVFVDIPKDAEHRDKKYMFIVHVYCAGEEVISGKYSRIFVTTS